MFELTRFGHRGDDYDDFKEMEELEKRIFGRQLPSFRTDIRENDKEYVLEAELPGFDKEDIHAEIRDGYLTVHAEHDTEKSKKDHKGNYVRRERTFGSYSRSFDLSGIDADKISAEYRHGVLTLTLPKAKENAERGKRIEIK